MQINIINNFSIPSYIKNTFSSLTNLQKKVLFISSIAFAAIVTIYIALRCSSPNSKLKSKQTKKNQFTNKENKPVEIKTKIQRKKIDNVQTIKYATFENDQLNVQKTVESLQIEKDPSTNSKKDDFQRQDDNTSVNNQTPDLKNQCDKKWNQLLLQNVEDNEHNKELIYKIKDLSADDARKSYLEYQKLDLPLDQKVGLELGIEMEVIEKEWLDEKGMLDIKNPLLLIRCVCKNSIELLKLLLASGAEANVYLKFSDHKNGDDHNDLNDDFSISLLFFATPLEHKECMQILMSAKADLTISFKGTTKSLFSFAKNPEEVLPMFLTEMQKRGLLETCGIIDDPKNKFGQFRDGYTPLMDAGFNGNDKLAKALIGAGANVNASCVDGWTPLMSAVNGGNEQLVSALINAGADLNAIASHDKGENRFTALSLAAILNREKIVPILLQAGADATKTPIFIYDFSCKEMLQMLENAGADIREPVREPVYFKPLIIKVKKREFKITKIVKNQWKNFKKHLSKKKI